MKLSSRVADLKPSQTLAIDAKAKALKEQGKDVVGFGVGEPDFDTPDIIKAAAHAAINAGYTKYLPAAGSMELRRAVAEKYNKDYGLDYKPEEVIVTCGAKHAIYQAFQALLEPGDEVLIPAPYWVSYPPMVELADGAPVIVPARESAGFIPTTDDIEAKITPRTRAIVINSPSNPTGGVYGRQALLEIAELAIRRDLVVISDDIYDKLLYDGLSFTCFPTLDPRLRDRTILINGVSKTYAMTGWRIGYALAPKPFIKAVADLQSQSTSNMTSIAQKAAVAALKMPDADIQPMIEAFAARRNLMFDLLSRIPGVKCFKPQGAFYVFPNFAAFYGKTTGEGKAINNSFDLCDHLLESALVAAVPGGAFGADENIRLSYAADELTIKKGIERIARAVAELK